MGCSEHVVHHGDFASVSDHPEFDVNCCTQEKNTPKQNKSQQEENIDSATKADFETHRTPGNPSSIDELEVHELMVDVIHSNALTTIEESIVSVPSTPLHDFSEITDYLLNDNTEIVELPPFVLERMESLFK